MTKSFDRIADSYDATRGGEQRGRWIATDLHPLFSKPGAVLEIGVGTGAIALGLRELGRTVVGVDIGLEMLKHAQNRIGPCVAQGDAECLPIRTASVDDACSVWLLHLVDVVKVVREVVRVLKPCGRYVVSQGQKRDLTTVEVIEAEMLAELRSADTRSQGRAKLSSIAEANGLTLVEEHLGSPQRYGVTPEKAAQRIEARSRSALWDVDDERWQRIVVPAIAKIRALPQPDVRLFGEAQARFLVFER